MDQRMLCRKKGTKACSFEGNACKKLLDSVDKLRSKKNIHHIKYVQLLQDLKNVIYGCFGNELKPSFEKSIENFKNNYLLSGISVTPKIHAIFFHVLDFCNENNCRLGFYSEQAVESIHHKFKKLRSNYMVKKRENPKYDESIQPVVAE